MFFQTAAETNVSWLSLSYNAAENSFVAGYALDENGAPGIWSFSEPCSSVEPDDDGWYLGLAYSAQDSMDFDPISAEFDGLHGITFDHFSGFVPEPSGSTRGWIALCAFGLARRKQEKASKPAAS